MGYPLYPESVGLFELTELVSGRISHQTLTETFVAAQGLFSKEDDLGLMISTKHRAGIQLFEYENLAQPALRIIIDIIYLQPLIVNVMNCYPLLLIDRKSVV